MELIQNLEPRYFKPGHIIINELDEIMEFYCVQKGNFNVGYEINKKRYYRIKFGAGNLLGAFNLHFNYRA